MTEVKAEIIGFDFEASFDEVGTKLFLSIEEAEATLAEHKGGGTDG